MATFTRRAPAAANYTAQVGRIVREGAAAGECVLAGAAAAAASGALLLATTQRPLGVIVYADDSLGGDVTIAGPGELAWAIFDGILAYTGGDALMSDAASEVVAAAVAGPNTHVYSVGRYLGEGEAATQAGGLHRILVTCEALALA